MATKFKTRENAKQSKGEVQKNRELMTVPDNATSLREIIGRFAHGVPVTKAQSPIFNEEWEFDDLKNMDVLDIHELKQHVAEQVENKKEVVNENKRKLAEQQKRKADIQAKEKSDDTSGQ